MKDFVRCNNFSIGGAITAPDLMAVWHEGLWDAHTSLREASLAELSADPPAGALTNFATYRIYVAAMIRSGRQVGHGVENPVMLSRQEHARLLHLGNVELEFERARREIAPDAASRLTCFFVVVDDDSGRRLLQRMFPSPDMYIVTVVIPGAIRVTRADVGWYEAFVEDGRPEYAERYWHGDPRGDDASWEYLVEGTIELINPEHRRYLRRAGGAAFGLRDGFPGPPV